MILFFALLSLALAIAGATAFVIFWPLALVHLRERHPAVHARLGPGAFLHPGAGHVGLRGGAVLGDRGGGHGNCGGAGDQADGKFVHESDSRLSCFR